MKNIKDILVERKEISGDQVIKILDEVCENGDVMMIKSDGLRTSSKYTVVIGSSKQGFEPIRFDADILNDAILKALNEYIKYIPDHSNI